MESLNSTLSKRHSLSTGWYPFDTKQGKTLLGDLDLAFLGSYAREWASIAVRASIALRASIAVRAVRRSTLEFVWGVCNCMGDQGSWHSWTLMVPRPASQAVCRAVFGCFKWKVCTGTVGSLHTEVEFRPAEILA